MNPKQSDPVRAVASVAGTATARLFVSGDSALSVIALARLRTAIRAMPVQAYALEVILVDLRSDPAAAFEHRVFLTPTLMLTTDDHIGPRQTSTMVGDLGDERTISAFLARLLR